MVQYKIEHVQTFITIETVRGLIGVTVIFQLQKKIYIVFTTTNC